MKSFPIAERELRVAARRRGTYWIRFAAAAGAISAATVGFLAMMRERPTEQGQVLFTALSILAFVYALLSGVLTTSDCVSEEKREGTLGLLFLTDLRGRDVVAGKMVASSVRAVLGLLSIIPIIAVPVMMGGVSVQSLWSIALSLFNTLFLSLAIGVLVSSLARDARHAVGGTLVALAAILILVPILRWLLLEYVLPASSAPAGRPLGRLGWMLMVNPAVLLASAIERLMRGPGAPADVFWMSLVVQHVLAWGCVVTACVVLPRTWQVRSESGSGGRSATRSSEEQSVGHRERAAVLDAHPFAWMVVREGRTVVFTWLGLGVIVGVWYWGYWEMKDEWLHAAVAMVTTFFAAFWLKLRVASVASRHLHEHRRAGALELVLSTPLQPPAILQGHLAGLRHQFLGPAIAVVLGATLLLAFALGAERGGADHFEVICIFVVGLVLFGVDLWALSWVGMWQAMRNARYIRAYGTTVFLVLTAPWCAFVISLVLIGVLAEVLDLIPTLDPTAMVMLVWWTVLSVGTDLGLALRARRLLQRDLPALALDHYGSGPAAPSPRPGLPA
ncbi:MAG: ABC transporter permease subunit [Verrucomicrobiales bacterium]|nr:ABC transporter permease subunit [Verrucomicrobiales bacterium]